MTDLLSDVNILREKIGTMQPALRGGTLRLVLDDADRLLRALRDELQRVREENAKLREALDGCVSSMSAVDPTTTSDQFAADFNAACEALTPEAPHE